LYIRAAFAKSNKVKAFSFAEVCVAITVCAIFGAAAFATNQRLLLVLKSQRETTAATMMLQERMEKFRGFAYSNIGNAAYVNTNLIQSATTSEANLPGFTETITVSGYLDTSGNLGDGSAKNAWTRTSSSNSQSSSYGTLATSFDLLKVDIRLDWNSADGRSRTRDLSAIFGKGNIGP
jgi:hypothetical protein